MSDERVLSRRDFAFLYDVKDLPKLYLIEVSARRRLTKKCLDIFASKTWFSPKAMAPILSAVLYDSKVFHKENVKRAMFEVLRKLGQHDNICNLQYETLVQVAIESVIDAELEKMRIIGPITRSRGNHAVILKSKWKQLRTKRKEEERHLQISFAVEVQRSIREFNYVYNSLK
jgi:hypothetical protein